MDDMNEVSAELPIRVVLDFANGQLREKSLQPITRRTIDYWISVGLIDHPKRKGKAGGGLFPERVKLHLLCIRELQEHFNFTLADLRAVSSTGSRLEDVLNLMVEVEKTYGRPLLPYARQYVCSHRVGVRARDESASFYVARRVADGDEELGLDQVAALLGIDKQSVLDLASNGELPCHGELQKRFLKSEVGQSEAKNSFSTPTVFAELMEHLIRLTNELRRVDNLDALPDNSREWLSHWVDAVDNELWRMRRLGHAAQMRKRKVQ